jgi:hypothetical protein
MLAATEPIKISHGKIWLMIIAMSGALYLAVLTYWTWTLSDQHHFGSQIYDAYYAALLDGRFDLSARVLRFEGHYAPDGRGYLYHGLAPLLTRFILGWAWPFEVLPMIGVSIWFWSVVGIAAWQSVVVTLARSADVWIMRRRLVLCLCGALWVAGPGPLLVVNLSFFHEPIAVSFAFTGLFAAVWTRACHGQLGLGFAVALLAVFAAVVLHARPNVAVGLYFGTILAVLWGIKTARGAFVLPAFIALSLLGAGASGYLGANAARFGDIGSVHGSFSGDDIIYGNVYWGVEDADSERAAAFEEHGRFNILRVVPNGIVYIFYLPTGHLSVALERIYRGVTEPVLGFIRIEPMRLGLLMIWPMWCLLALSGIKAVRYDPKMACLVVALAMSAGLTLAYGTIAFRYRFDLWSIVAVLACLGAIAVMRVHQSENQIAPSIRYYALALLGGLVVMDIAQTEYKNYFRERPGFYFQTWSEDFCLQRASALGLGLSDAQTQWTCRPPPYFGDN